MKHLTQAIWMPRNRGGSFANLVCKIPGWKNRQNRDMMKKGIIIN